jgi:hypothetical protein
MEDWDTNRWLARTLAWENTLTRLRHEAEKDTSPPKELTRAKKSEQSARARHAARLPRPSTAA